MAGEVRRDMSKINPKVTAATVGGAVATIIIWVGAQFHVEVTPEVGAALATVFAFAAGYLKAA